MPKGLGDRLWMKLGEPCSKSSDIIPVQSIVAKLRPRGLIKVISTIEYYHAQEKRGVILSTGFFTLKQKIEYFEVGFRGAFVSGLITAMITPLAIAENR